MITQGWPLWAVSDEGDGRYVYAIVGWTDEDMEPIGIMLAGAFDEGRAAEVLSCKLTIVSEWDAAWKAAGA